MSDGQSRRDVLRQIGAGLLGTGVLTAQEAGHVHHAVEKAKAGAPGAAYKPRFFNAREYAALRALADLIMPGAGAAGAPEFIDLLAGSNEEIGAIYTGGLAWLDTEMRRRCGAPFEKAKPADQTALLDLLAFRRNDSPELGPGIRFFEWARNMTVDAYFSSKAGMDYLGFMGNGAMSEFSVPEEAVKYALKRSPV